jgi:hypothetical protein
LIFLVVLYFVMRGVLRIVRLFFGMTGAELSIRFRAEWASRPTRSCASRCRPRHRGLYPYIPGSIRSFQGRVAVPRHRALAWIVCDLQHYRGLPLTYRRAFRVGDRVKIADIVGDVTVSWLQVTHCLQGEGSLVPNSQIVNGRH